MIPVGITISSQVMVGNNIGANKVSVAKVYGFMGFKLGVIWSFFTIALLLILKSPLPGLFSNDDTVLSIISTAYPVMLTYVFIDCI